ncbi:hypothetical protein FCV25MIE_01744 [Fagus crenata]
MGMIVEGRRTEGYPLISTDRFGSWLRATPVCGGFSRRPRESVQSDDDLEGSRSNGGEGTHIGRQSEEVMEGFQTTNVEAAEVISRRELWTGCYKFDKILHGGLTKHEEDILHIESLRAMGAS